MKRYLTYAAALLCTFSCIYSYDAETPEAEKLLVMEGDIIVGDTTKVDVRYIQNLSSVTSSYLEERPTGTCWIEDNKSRTYQSLDPAANSHFEFDTRDLKTNRSYRLCYKDGGTGRLYKSSLQGVCTAPTIDQLYYKTDADNVHIVADLTGNDGCRYFRWDFTQTWEYTADFAPTVYFDPETQQTMWYDERMHGQNWDYYYCWNSSLSSDFSVASSAEYSKNALREQPVTSIGRSDKRFSSLYRINVEVRGLNASAYEYLDNMRKISAGNSSLFMPNPSDMPGNVTCMDDEEEIVYGYINACTIMRDTLYIKSADVYVYPNVQQYLFEPEVNNLVTYNDWYSAGFRPVKTDLASGITYWARERCVDCRGYGGTKTKPEGWPTNNN